MKYRKKSDLYNMPLLSKLYFKSSGSYIVRIPGGWVFVYLAGYKMRFLCDVINPNDEKETFPSIQGLGL